MWGCTTRLDLSSQEGEDTCDGETRQGEGAVNNRMRNIGTGSPTTVLGGNSDKRMSTRFWRDLEQRTGATWTAVLDRHPYGCDLFYYSKFCAVLQTSQTELLGIVGVSFCQNFATCALNKSHLIFVADISYTSSSITASLELFDRFNLLNAPVSRSLAVHALHCQPQVQGNNAHFRTPTRLTIIPQGNKSFVAFSNLSDCESLTKTWKVRSLIPHSRSPPFHVVQVCTKVASYLEQGQRLENLSWRLWHLQNLIVDSDNAKSKREFKKLSKIMGDKLDKEKGRSVHLPILLLPTLYPDSFLPCVGASRSLRLPTSSAMRPPILFASARLRESAAARPARMQSPGLLSACNSPSRWINPPLPLRILPSQSPTSDRLLSSRKPLPDVAVRPLVPTSLATTPFMLIQTLPLAPGSASVQLMTSPCFVSPPCSLTTLVPPPSSQCSLPFPVL